MENDKFILGLLNQLGLKATANRVNFFRAWIAYENTTALNNPLATTYDQEPDRTDKYIGGYYFNNNGGYPVKNYSSQDQGILATAKTLKNGYYNNIINGLNQDQPFSTWIINAVNDFATYGGAGYADRLYGVWLSFKDLPFYTISAIGIFFLLSLTFLLNKYKPFKQFHK